MSLRPRNTEAAAPSRLEHVLRVGMTEEIGAKAAPVTHWMDKRNTVKSLADAMKKDMEKKVPEKMFRAFVEALSAPKKANSPPTKISITLDTGLLLKAEVTIPSTFTITVNVIGEDYNEATVTSKSTYSPLPTNIQYKTFVDVVISSVAQSLERMFAEEPVKSQRK